MGSLRLIGSFVLLLAVFDKRDDSSLNKKTTYYPEYACQIIDSLKEKVAEKYNLRCHGRGGSMPYDIMSLSVDFQSKEEATISQSRELLVQVSEDFLQIINRNENALPFLREYPFPVNRLTISINFCSFLNERFENQIESVLLAKGKVYYSIRDKKTFRHTEIHEEPYEEALRIVNSSF